MVHRVTFRRGAVADLETLYDYIAEHSGLVRAGQYIQRIEAACLRLRHFPNRGTNRADIAEGLRTIGFERRVLIAFRVLPSEVNIVAILYRGRPLTSEVIKRR